MHEMGLRWPCNYLYIPSLLIFLIKLPQGSACMREASHVWSLYMSHVLYPFKYKIFRNRGSTIYALWLGCTPEWFRASSATRPSLGPHHQGSH
jgi:hypothetical protein